GQADARRGLALSCRSGAHGGDEDESAGRGVRARPIEDLDGHLRLGPPVGNDVLCVQTQPSGDVDDGIELGAERNIHICGHKPIMPLLLRFVTIAAPRVCTMRAEFRLPQQTPAPRRPTAECPTARLTARSRSWIILAGNIPR